MRADPTGTSSPTNDRAPEPTAPWAVPTGVQLLDYVRILYRRRWLAAAVLTSVVLAVAVYNYTAVPLYQAQATVLIESLAPNVVGFEEVLDEETWRVNYYQTQYELLESRALAERTVKALELWKRPELGAGSEAEAVGAVRAGLLITPVRGSRIVHVGFRSSEPALAADIANAYAREYIEQGLENRFRASKEAADWLDGQLAGERKRVQETESALQAFRERHDAVSLEEGQNIIVQKLADLNAAVTRAKTNRIEKEAQYRELLAIQDDRAAVDSFPAILSNAFIQRLKGDLATTQREYAQLTETLGDRHPTLIEKRSAVEMTEKRLAAEVTRVMESVHNAFRAAQAEEASMVAALDEQKREAQGLNRRGIEYAALAREAESVRLVYQSLLQRATETSVTRELRATNIRIIDLAMPPGGPVSPRTNYNLFMALLAGSLLAIGAVFSVEFLDDRIKTPDDLRRQLRPTFLGLVPEVRSKDRRQIPLLLHPVPPEFAEAIRAMRTGVISSSSAKRPQSILVASTAEGEGKTIVASNLAIALAQSRQRVLLVDADMRRPKLHNHFGCALEPGLSNVLDGTGTLPDGLRHTSIPGLMILSGGTATAQAPELLGSALFNELFDVIQEHFDWVIVDSPPTLAVTDASVVARRASGIVFVVGAGMTSSRAARLAVEELLRAGGRVVGTVLNRADLQHHSFYFSPYTRGAYIEPSNTDGGRGQVAAPSLIQ